jgi:4'-phosphopantetheinyl transferase
VSQLLSGISLSRSDPDEVHVWTADIGRIQGCGDECIDGLSTDERARAARFRFVRDRRRFITRRALLRRILAHYLGCRPELISFRYDRYGKPTLEAGKLFFSVSSSFDRAIYALAYGRKVGVDVEKIRAFGDMDSVAKRIFSPAEFRSYSFGGKAAKQALFFRYWTRKEAVIKAVGCGWSYPLDTLDVSANGKGSIRQVETRTARRKAKFWTVRDLDHLPGFASAVATEGPIGTAPSVKAFLFP